VSAWQVQDGRTCSHAADAPPSSGPADACEDCLRTGGQWVHLRICLECGHVGCCDSSPNRHATAHVQSSGHPIVRSIEPGEDWSWCYVDEVAMRIPEVRGAPRIPRSPLA
jgi:uncharacterized UBP type Zn finger protein